jgi:molybdate transport system permease protein
VTRTLPLEIYLQRVTDANAAVALSILLVAVAALVVLGLGARRLTGTDAR